MTAQKGRKIGMGRIPDSVPNRTERPEKAPPPASNVARLYSFFTLGDPFKIPEDFSAGDFHEAVRLVARGPAAGRLPGVVMIRQALGARLQGDIMAFLRRGKPIYQRTLAVNGVAAEVLRRTAADELLKKLGLVVDVRVDRLFTDVRPLEMTD